MNGDISSHLSQLTSSNQSIVTISQRVFGTNSMKASLLDHSDISTHSQTTLTICCYREIAQFGEDLYTVAHRCRGT